MPRFANRTHNSLAAIIFAAVIWAVPDRALAQTVELRPWSEILIVVGHDVALSLPDGYVRGKAMAVTSDALELDIEESSNTAAFPKGPFTVSRSLITVVRLRKGDGRAPRVAGATIGQAAVFGGLAGLGARNGTRGMLRNAGIQIGAAALGSAIGRRLDDRQEETLIRIAPEPAAVSRPGPGPVNR
jgi:hypothetical protein